MTDKSLSERKIKEACGIFGIISRETSELARKTYFGLFALQHRGAGKRGYCGFIRKGQGSLL